MHFIYYTYMRVHVHTLDRGGRSGSGLTHISRSLLAIYQVSFGTDAHLTHAHNSTLDRAWALWTQMQADPQLFPLTGTSLLTLAAVGLV